ncbi:MAG: fumarylacetoacetate hydrolase family protein [Candidatus Omnitrophota bacterium]
MRILRFYYQDNVSWGILNDDSVAILSDSPFNAIKISRKKILLSKVKILAPAQPSKIILAGLNYRGHAREMKMAIPKEPVIFLKAPTSVIANGENIIYPLGVKRLDYEAELALIIKKKARSISTARVQDYILGYTCLNDVTARDLQKKDGQWARAKSFDTFCPVGPWIETDLNFLNLRIRCWLNNKLRQDSHTGDFIFSVNYLVSYISRVMTLLPGDIISTGTPAGVGSMRPGDKVEVEIEGLGKLSNFVK